jgi:hypothetical protein
MVAMPRGLLRLQNSDVNSRGKRLRVIKVGRMEIQEEIYVLKGTNAYS